MRKIILNIALPISLVVFRIITKWEFVQVQDHTKEFLFGFPFAYKCKGFHTSLSKQYFMLEMIANFLIYFIIITLIIVGINRVWKLKIRTRLSQIFWIGFCAYILGFWYLSSETSDQFYWKRDFKITTLKKQGISILDMHPDRQQIDNE